MDHITAIYTLTILVYKWIDATPGDIKTWMNKINKFLENWIAESDQLLKKLLYRNDEETPYDYVHYLFRGAGEMTADYLEKNRKQVQMFWRALSASPHIPRRVYFACMRNLSHTCDCEGACNHPVSWNSQLSRFWALTWDQEKQEVIVEVGSRDVARLTVRPYIASALNLYCRGLGFGILSRQPSVISDAEERVKKLSRRGCGRLLGSEAWITFTHDVGKILNENGIN